MTDSKNNITEQRTLDEQNIASDTLPNEEMLIPVKFNKEIKNIPLQRATELAQKGMKFEMIEENYETLKSLALAENKSVSTDEALKIASEIDTLSEEKKTVLAERIALNSELERLKDWGDIDPDNISDLAANGVEVSLYEMPKKEYEALGENIKTLSLNKTKASVKFLLIASGNEDEMEAIKALESYKLELPQMSTAEIKQKIADLGNRVEEIEDKIS